ncbi:MAG: hypothetical protein JST11_18790 [Acidobacteria bacterium]|nr:hypothetical protein [Acidobacteriota bacterium]
MICHVVVCLLGVLAPLVPAVLIYRLFPGTGVTVSGPLSALSIRASGAFAAYVIVFLLMIPLLSKFQNTIGGFTRPVWTVTATIVPIDKDGKPVDAPYLVGSAKVTITPEVNRVNNKQVIMRIPVLGGDWPSVTVTIPQWGASDVPIPFPQGTVIDQYSKEVTLRHPIQIRQVGGGQYGASSSQGN